MKKLIIVLLAFFTAMAAVAQQVEIYPEMGPQGRTWVKFSPDGKWILTDKGIWDATSGRELKRSYNTSIIGWSPDMKRYLQRSGTTIRVRDWETDAVICTIENIKTNDNDSLPLFSPDGNQVAAVTSDGKKIKISNAVNGQELMIVDGWEGGIGLFCYNADGKNILLTNYDTVKVFDLANKRQVSTFSVKVTDSDLTLAILSPNGKFYIVPYTNNSRRFIKIFDTVTGKDLYTLSGYNSVLTSLACSADGQKIVSGDRDNTIKIWDVGTGKELRTIKIDGDYINSVNCSLDNRKFVYSLSFSQNLIVLDAGNYREMLTTNKKLPQITNANYTINGKQAIVQTEDIISLWDMEAGKRLWITNKPKGYIGNKILYFSPDRQLFANTEDQSSANKVQINIYNTATGSHARSWHHIVNVSSNDEVINDWGLVWSQDGKELVSYVGSVIMNAATRTARYYFYINLWNVSDGKLISSNRHERGTISGTNTSSFSSGRVYFSPDVNRIIYNYGDSLQIYETRGTRKFATIAGSYKEVRWSPNSSRILTASSDGTVKQWNAQNGQQLPGSIKHENLTAVEYSPDGKQFATGGNDKYVRVWNAENGAKLWERSFSYMVDSIIYSADGKRIITNASPYLYILDSANGNILFSKSEKSASLSPDGKWVITASWYGSVHIWSLETGVEKARLITYDDGEWLAMTPDGYYNASAKGDQYLNARVGNTVTGIDRYRSTYNKPAVVQARLSNSGRMSAHKESITSVAVNPSGTRIASVSLDKTIKLWDLESGKELRTISNIGGSVNTVSFSPDGKTIIHGAEDKTIRIWDAETGRAIRTINGHGDDVNEARYSSDGKRIASCADDKLIKIWDAESGREIRTLSGHTDLVTVVAWSPDGKRIASGSDEKEKTIRIWDAENGRVLQTISGQGGRVRGIVYSPDGKKLASCTAEEPVLKIWDAETGRQIRSIPIEDGAPYSVAWSPDGKRIAVGYIYDKSDGSMYIFNAETGAEIHDIWVNGAPQSLTWTSDGRRIITACNFNDARVIKVFDALSGNEL